MKRALRDVVEKHTTIVCAGSGGVGKTTTAAAIALWGAMNGRRTVVLTIDPARRLADSLGLAIEGSAEAVLSPEAMKDRGLETRAPLAARMLDQKGAWDALIERHAPSPEVKERVLGNRFYQHLSQSFAGSQEYMAIEELCSLQESGRFDLIVVDTPPSRHALDFLEAPRRISDFLDKKVVKWFVGAGFSGMRIMNRTAGFVARKLEEATGVGVLSEVTEFFESMSTMFEGFSERIDRVYKALRGSGTAFILVSSPEEQVLEEAEYLSEQMAALGMPLRGLVFNRVHFEFAKVSDEEEPDPVVPNGEIEPVEEILARAGIEPKSLARSLAENFVAYEALARGDGLRLEQFSSGLEQKIPIVQVPNFSTDLHRVESLVRLHPHLFEEA